MLNHVRLVRFMIGVAVVCATIVIVVPTAVAARPPKLPWDGPGIRTKPGHLIVTFEAGTSLAQRRRTHSDVGARPADQSRRTRVDVVELPPGVSALAAIRRYEADPRVLSAELDRFADLTVIPDDPHFPKQWALNNTGQLHRITGSNRRVRGRADADVDAPEAWDASTPGGNVVVAVLDSGVDVDHPDLANSMWENPVEQAGTTGVDDDGNGYVDDVNGWDFRRDDPDPSPGTNLEGSHGTHVAGIIAAERANGIGIAGICGACRIMGLRFDLSLGQEVAAIEYAVANGADVINMSFASPVWSPAERAAILAAGSAGVLTVVAAGNSSADNDIPLYVQTFAPAFPASYNLPTILSVAASNQDDQYGVASSCSGLPRWRCAFTSWGHDSVDVAAPGVDILSTVPPAASGDVQSGYQVSDGTSMSAPLVAGIAGAVKHEHPAYSPLDLKNAVMNSVDHPATLKLLTSLAEITGLPKVRIQGKFTRTQGRVNAAAALSAPITNATPLTDGNIDGAMVLGARVAGQVAWPSDVNDVYRKTLLEGKRYRITLDGPSGRDMDLYVWRSAAKEIHQFTSGCFLLNGPCPALKAVSTNPNADERVTFTVGNTGTFFIQVQGWYSGGPYALAVHRI